jgi:hypothetical protein
MSVIFILLPHFIDFVMCFIFVIFQTTEQKILLFIGVELFTSLLCFSLFSSIVNSLK